MLKKILKKDLSRNKLIIAILFVFIMLAAMLTASAVSLVIELSGSVTTLFEKSAAPHFVQMYAGEPDQEAIDTFSQRTGIVSSQQTATLLNINGAYIFLGNQKEAQTNSILENSFVIQNQKFDFLLDQNNEVLEVNPGEIGVPVYYMKQNHLKTGDRITVRKGDFSQEFIIRDFVRDVQMNSSLVTSKRFLVNEQDWAALEKHLGEKEYLIEFILTDVSKIKEFESLYQSSGLPQSGTAITYSLYQLLNALSDGIVAAVIILVTVLLLLISFISMRFILLSTIEEDYQEIGNMKAIGISYRQLRSLYLVKYLFVCGFACLCGYLLSITVQDLFIQNITLYMGKAAQTPIQFLFPLFGAVVIFFLTAGSCSMILRRFKKISVTDALRNKNYGAGKHLLPGLCLHRSRQLDVNLFLGWNELFVKLHTYSLLCFVFVICMFLMAVPVHLLSTLKSPTFITYMGAGESNIRIDISQSKDMSGEYAAVMETLAHDPDVESYASFATGAYKTQNAESELENLKVENGDFSQYSLQYTDGHAPQTMHQIALSVLNAKELGKKAGSTMAVLDGEKEYFLEVCGIYQDITNGGKTAKAMLPCDPANVLWYVININVKNDTPIPAKISEYTGSFSTAKVTDMASYVSQTFGSVLNSLDSVVKLAVVLSLAIAVLITALFIKLLTAREKMQTAGLMSIGFSVRMIRQQYIIRILSVLITGIIVGTIAAETAGPRIAGILLSGISSLHFVINPFAAYILCPLMLLAAVSTVVYFSTGVIKHSSVMTLENER